MRYIAFPDQVSADNFMNELQETGHLATRSKINLISESDVPLENSDKTALGTAAGTVAGITLGTAATALTGGLLALPLILGGAIVGGVTGANAGIEEDKREEERKHGVAREQYELLTSHQEAGRVVVTVDDSIDNAAANAAAARFNGHWI